MKLLRRIPLWRLILLALAAAGIVVFLMPLMGGIHDFSNLSAAAAFGLAALALLFWKPFVRILHWFWRRLWGRILLLVTGIGILVLGIALGVLSILVMSGMSSTPARDCPTVVVLGCQVRGTVPSRLLRFRIEAAAEYLQEHPGSVAVLTGGQGSNEDITEAECMYRELVKRGIDPARLYKEEQSTVTLENLQNAKDVIEQKGLHSPVLIVSNSFHIYRAKQMAADLGLDAEGLSAAGMWYSTPTYILREAMALIKYKLLP